MVSFPPRSPGSPASVGSYRPTSHHGDPGGRTRAGSQPSPRTTSESFKSPSPRSYSRQGYFDAYSSDGRSTTFAKPASPRYTSDGYYTTGARPGNGTYHWRPEEPNYYTTQSPTLPRRRSSTTSIGKPALPQASASACSKPKAAIGPAAPRTSSRRTAPSKATAEDAKKHNIPPTYSLKNWDPTEEPILLLGSVFDANSIGKWIYDWTAYSKGAGTPIADMAGDLWLLLIQLAGKVKRAEESVGRVVRKEDRELIEDFIDSGERLTDKFRKLLKTCEAPMLKAAKKQREHTLGSKAGVEFIDTLFGRERELEKTEKFMQSVRLFSLRFDANCEGIMEEASRKGARPAGIAPLANSASMQHRPRPILGPKKKQSSGEDNPSPGSERATSEGVDSAKDDYTSYSDVTDMEELTKENPFFGIVNILVQSGLEKFSGWHQLQSGHDGRGGQMPKKAGKQTDSSASRKRARVDDEQTSVNGDDGTSRAGGKKRKSNGIDDGENTLSLACPYYKRNHFKHNKCLLFRLNRIKDVKQHLCRKHKQPPYCPICGDEFQTQVAQLEHIRRRSCNATQHLPDPEGITEDQQTELSSRVDRTITIEQQWFAVWHIVFPGTAPPSSPYIKSPIQEILCNFRRFWNEQGQQLISDHLRTHGGLPYEMPAEERSLAALHNSVAAGAMAILVDRYIASYSAATEDESEHMEVSVADLVATGSDEPSFEHNASQAAPMLMALDGSDHPDTMIVEGSLGIVGPNGLENLELPAEIFPAPIVPHEFDTFPGNSYFEELYEELSR